MIPPQAALGDPRNFDPEIFAGLRRFEKLYVEGRYRDRITRYGRGQSPFPDGESAASIAHRSTLTGIGQAAIIAWGIAGWVFILASSISLWGRVPDESFYVAYGAIPAAIFFAASAAIRMRRVDHQFRRRYAPALGHWPSHPGFDPAPADSATSSLLGLSSAEKVQRGDPVAYAPEIFAGLGWLEQTQVKRVFARRAAMAGGGGSRHSDDEPAHTIARIAFASGIRAAAILATLPVIVAVITAIGVVVRGPAPVAGWAVMLSPIWFGVLGFRTYRRRRRVLRGLDARYMPGRDSSLETTSSAADRVALGEPSRAAPEALEKLSSWEKLHVARHFAHRLSAAGTGDRRYPDDESPESIAGSAIRGGITTVGWLLGLPVYALIGYALSLLLSGASAVAVVALAGSLTLLFLLMLRTRRRRDYVGALVDPGRT